MSAYDKGPNQADLARKAQEIKNAAEPALRRAPEQTANNGMTSIEKPNQAPSGAFGAEGQRPVLERSRKVR